MDDNPKRCMSKTNYCNYCNLDRIYALGSFRSKENGCVFCTELTTAIERGKRIGKKAVIKIAVNLLRNIKTNIGINLHDGYANIYVRVI